MTSRRLCFFKNGGRSFFSFVFFLIDFNSCLICMFGIVIYDIHFSLFTFKSIDNVYILMLNQWPVIFLKTIGIYKFVWAMGSEFIKLLWPIHFIEILLKYDFFPLFGSSRGGVGRRCRLWWRFSRLYRRPKKPKKP
jgi:hypothetical protein